MKCALVLEGGASRAYFTVGVLDALYDMGIKADYVIGTSAGIANGISYVSGQRGRSLEIGLSYLPDKRYMGLRHLINPKNRSLYNIKFVFDEIPNIHLPFDYDAYEKSGCRVIAALTNIETGKCEYVPVPHNDKKWRVVTASCALPLIFQPVEIDGKLYMDGGITDSIPVDKALSDGYEMPIVITTRERSYIKKDESALKISRFLYRKYPAFSEAIKLRTKTYNETHKRVLELEKEGKIIHIAPETDTSGWKRTEKSNNAVMKMYNEGYQTAMKYKDKIKMSGFGD